MRLANALGIRIGGHDAIEARLGGNIIWRAARAATAAASGGIETVIEQMGSYYRVHSFTDSGELTVSSDVEMEYLVVASGGGGGNTRGGGGGAGGVLRGAQPLSPGQYPVVVGAAKGMELQGDNSSLADIVAFGGGAGISSNGEGISGGSGGGAGGRTTGSGTGGAGVEGQGHAGGNATNENGGGGGGAGGPGQSGFDGRAGGPPIISDIDGVPKEYARGGRGAPGTNWSSEIEPANSGNGGKGRGATSREAGLSGSGIVIVRYRISQDEYAAHVR